MPQDIPISVSSWNCLADSYSGGPCAQKHPDINVVSWKYRSSLINKALAAQNTDIVCLQEVDHFEENFKPFFTERGYNVQYVQRPGRQDGLLIAFKKQKFHLFRKQIIHFDDLSNLNSILRPLTISSLRKQNIALVLILQPVMSHHSDTAPYYPNDKSAFMVCTTHLYWNPSYPHIKLAQAHYLMENLANIRVNSYGIPPCGILLTGDFNSEPLSEQYAVMTRGQQIHPIVQRDKSIVVRSAVSRMARQKKISSDSNVQSTDFNGKWLFQNSQGEDDGYVRFLCDATLVKLARWLRLLGLDAAVEDNESQERRAVHNDFNPLFSRARSEKRVLVTTSTSMLKRNSCPETFRIRTPSPTNELKKSLASLLNYYDVPLNKSLVFTICGKCGDSINPTDINDSRLAGKFAPKDRQIFICQGCNQPYWFSERSEGSSSRALNLAHSLVKYVEASRRKKAKRNGDEHENRPPRRPKPLPYVELCKQQWLRFHSVFSQVHNREPEYTNVNGPYHGTLDYVFVGGALRAWKANIHRHHPIGAESDDKLFPNVNWPSDHFLLRADLILNTCRTGRMCMSRTLSDL